MKYFLFCCFLLTHFSLAAEHYSTLYVSSEGSDGNDGSVSSPFQTLEKAVQVAEAAGAAADTLYIEVQPGDYYLDRPLTFTGALKRPVCVISAEEGKVRLIGGIPVTGWERWEENIYRAYVPEVVKYGFNFEHFYVDGHRATLARTPDKGWFPLKRFEQDIHVPCPYGREARFATHKLYMDPVQLQSLSAVSREEMDDVSLYFYNTWDVTKKRISYLDADSGHIYITGRGIPPYDRISRYYIAGYRNALDAPDEWFLDRKEGYLYYYPEEGVDLDRVECIAPVLRNILVIHGDKEKPVQGLEFRHLSFQYSAYNMPESGEEPVQAAAMTHACVEMTYAEKVKLMDCEVQHTGGYGLWMKEGCRYNTLEHCYFSDLGSGGIKIGVPMYPEVPEEICSGNVVNNSIITGIGGVLASGAGVAVLNASDSRVTHNEISDVRYSGISVGWVWGYNGSEKSAWVMKCDPHNELRYVRTEQVKSPAVRNYIAYNHIHHIGWGELSDMGGIYTLGESEGTVVTGNVIHDVLSYGYGGWGLYTDEGSSGITMSNNLVYDCKSGGFNQHYGKMNLVHNNIMAAGYHQLLHLTRIEKHCSFSFRNNILFQENGMMMSGPVDKAVVDIDSNLYWSEGNPLKFCQKYSFDEWKKMKEPHAVNKDPMFMDAGRHDFRFRSLKNVRKIGFVPFDHSVAGVYGPEEWRRKARLPEKTISSFNAVAGKLMR